jgi:hypothetical protein
LLAARAKKSSKALRKIVACFCVVLSVLVVPEANASSRRTKKSPKVKKRATSVPVGKTLPITTTGQSIPTIVTSVLPTSTTITPTTTIPKVLRYSMCDLMSRIDYPAALPEWSFSPIGNALSDGRNYFSKEPVAGQWIPNEVPNAERRSFCYAIFRRSNPSGDAEVTLATRRSARLVASYRSGPLESNKLITLAGLPKPVLQEISKAGYPDKYIIITTCTYGIDTDYGPLFVEVRIALGDPDNEYLVACSAGETLLRLSLTRLQTGLVRLIPVDPELP